MSSVCVVAIKDPVVCAGEYTMPSSKCKDSAHFTPCCGKHSFSFMVASDVETVRRNMKTCESMLVYTYFDWD